MCDYSLENYKARPAEAGEQYTLQRFPSGTMGFTSPRDAETAVCILPGATLELAGITEAVQRAYAVGPTEQVTMIQMPGGTHVHRDAVRFANDREISLQSLNAGITCSLVADYTDQVTKIADSLADTPIDATPARSEPALV